MTRGVDSSDVEAPEPRVIHVPSFVDAYVTVAARQLSSGTPELPVQRGRHHGRRGPNPCPPRSGGTSTSSYRAKGSRVTAWSSPGSSASSNWPSSNTPSNSAHCDSVWPTRGSSPTSSRNYARSPLPDVPEAKAFLGARATLFGRLREQHRLRSRSTEADVGEDGPGRGRRPARAWPPRSRSTAHAYKTLALLLLNSDSTSRDPDALAVPWHRWTSSNSHGGVRRAIPAGH